MSKEDDLKLTITDLPEIDEEGVAYEYTIKEHDVPGYAADVDGFDITNTRTDVKTIELSKTWLDNKDATGDRPESITVKLLQNGKEVATQEVTSDEDGNWEYNFTDLDEFDENGIA